MNSVLLAAITSVFRAGLASAGGILVGKGLFSQAVWDQLQNYIIGAALIVIPAVWGAVNKYVAERNAQNREAAAFAAGSTSMITTQEPKP